MKQILFAFTIAIMLNVNLLATGGEENTMNNDPKSYVLTIKSEAHLGNYLYLTRRGTGEWQVLDSAIFEAGKDIVFTGSIPAPEVFYLSLENSDKKIPFFVENSTITILPDFSDPEKTEVEGSSIHDEFLSYQNLFDDLNGKKQELYQQYGVARSSDNKEKMDELSTLAEELSDKEMEMNRNFVNENSDSYLSPYIIRRSMFYTLSLDELKAVVSKLDQKLLQSVYTQQLKAQIEVLDRVAVGKKFTDFKLPIPDGGELALSDVAGKGYLLIDFWASWCAPCRQENPNVVALYQEFHEKGFDILGVSFDNNDQNWKKAIEDDGLEWHHVSDLKGWGSEAGRLYGVFSIPHTVLLDENGVIIAKNLKSDALREKLEDLL